MTLPEPSVSPPHSDGDWQTSPSSNEAWRRYVLAATVLFAFAAFYFSGLSRYFAWDTIRANLDAWQTHVTQHLVLSALVFFLIYAAITALSLPAAAALTLLGGALFGRVLGTAIVSGASTLGATLAFLGSRYLLRDWVQGRYGDRLRVINEGVARDGAFYLFMLRLVPAVPFFLINLGMGLSPIRVSTYVVTSWLGMLLGTLLYVNAGTALSTMDSPRDALSPAVLGSLAVLGIVPLLIRKLIQWRVRPRHLVLLAIPILSLEVIGRASRTYTRYHVADSIRIPVLEYTNADYPEDSADRSLHVGQYNDRRLAWSKRTPHISTSFSSQRVRTSQKSSLGISTPA